MDRLGKKIKQKFDMVTKIQKKAEELDDKLGTNIQYSDCYWEPENTLVEKLKKVNCYEKKIKDKKEEYMKLPPDYRHDKENPYSRYQKVHLFDDETLDKIIEDSDIELGPLKGNRSKFPYEKRYPNDKRPRSQLPKQMDIILSKDILDYVFKVKKERDRNPGLFDKFLTVITGDYLNHKFSGESNNIDKVDTDDSLYIYDRSPINYENRRGLILQSSLFFDENEYAILAINHRKSDTCDLSKKRLVKALTLFDSCYPIKPQDVLYFNNFDREANVDEIKAYYVIYVDKQRVCYCIPYDKILKRLQVVEIKEVEQFSPDNLEKIEELMEKCFGFLVKDYSNPDFEKSNSSNNSSSNELKRMLNGMSNASVNTDEFGKKKSVRKKRKKGKPQPKPTKKRKRKRGKTK